MKQVAMAIVLCASFCCAQEPGNFEPAETNVQGAIIPVSTVRGGRSFV